MSTYSVVWLSAITLVTIASTVIVGLGCYLLRPTLDDLSNSTTWRAYVLRLCRIVPGLAISGFGCFMFYEILRYVLVLAMPR